jgi:uncharacterized protein DUF3352
VRRIGLVAVVAAGAILAFGSCGGDSEDPLDQALGVLPANAPVAVAISTNLDSGPYEDVDAALQRFGVEGGLDGSLEQLGGGGEGISFARDVRPLLGNDLVVGIPSSPGGLGEAASVSPVVAAVRVSDGDAVRELLSDAGLEEIDQVEGTSVYGLSPPEGAPEGAPPEGPGVAVDGDLVIAAESNRGVEQALAQRGEDDRLTEALFSDRLGGLPDGGIVRAAGDVPRVLESLGIEQTVAVPWVKSLRSYGLTVNVEGRTLNLDAALSGEEVAGNDLPLDPGSRSPRVLKKRPTVATRDQAQSVEFALAVVRAAVPQTAFEEVTNRLQRNLGGGVSSLIDQFGEGLVARLPGDTTVTRSVVEDPAAVAKALEGLHDEVPLLARLGNSSSSAGQALEAARYAIPALPVPDPASFPPGSKVHDVRGMPDLYRLVAPAPKLPPGVRRVQLHVSRPELVFGLIDGVFVTAPSVKAGRDARDARPIHANLPPGALAFRIPVKASDLGISETAGVGVTVTTIEGGVEASTTGLRLRAQAGL